MNNEARILQVRKHLRDRQLGAALSAFAPLLGDRLFLPFSEKYQRIQSDYGLMLDFMLSNNEDPTRETLYRQLLGRLYRLTADADVAWRMGNKPLYRDAALRVAKWQYNHAEIRQRLEDFVADVAMLELVEELRREQRSEELRSAHADFTAWLFDSILISYSWSADTSSFYEQLLTSPTVDANDAALMVSAITLSCLNVFDPRKWHVLAAVSLSATEEKVAQRALVGWALAAHTDAALFQNVADDVALMLADSRMADALFQLQRQLFLCMNAEKDTKQIQQDIMPTIIKHNSLTQLGLNDQDEDPLQDILHPNADDEAMEEVEASIHRMMDMQKAGADIYFGGFSMMKRYGFFYQLCNWFRPFDSQQPELAHTRRKLGALKLLDVLTENGPFCDSDKYSFALAMASVIDKIPEQMREMLNQAEMFGPVEQEDVLHSAAYLRRMYLQDLYRFFRLSDMRTWLENPFGGDEGERALFFASPLFVGLAPSDRITQLCGFLLKQGRYTCLRRLLDAVPHEAGDADLDLLQGSCLIHERRYAEAVACLKPVYDMRHDDLKVAKAYAKACYLAESYDEAVEAYRQLHEAQPQQVQHLLYLSMSLLRSARSSEAVGLLYQYYFDHEDDLVVMRVLAWALLCDRKAQQAQRYFRQLVDSQAAESSDFLNAAYCEWILRNTRGAVDLFRRFLHHPGHGGKASPRQLLTAAMQMDADMLVSNGLSDVEQAVMTDIVLRES